MVLGDGGLSLVLKKLTDLGTVILKIANTDAGKMIMFITSTTLLISGLNKQLNTTPALIKKLSNEVQLMSMAFKDAEGGAKGFLAALDIADLSTQALMLSTLFAAVYEGFKIYQDKFSFQGQVDGVKELAQETEEAKSKADELKTELENVNEQIKEIKSGQIELTDENDLQRLETQKALLESELALEKSIAEAKQQQAKIDAQKAINSRQTTSKDVNVYQYGNQTFADERTRFFVKSDDVLKNSVNGIKDVTQALNDLNKAYENNEISQDEYEQSSNRLISALEDMQSQGIEVAQNYLTLQEAGGILTDEQKELVSLFVALTNASSDTASGLESQEDLLSSLSDSIGEPISSLDDLESKMQEAGLDVEAFQEAVTNEDWATAYGYASQLVQESTEDTTSALEQSISAINDSYNAYNTLSQAVADFNSGAYIDPSNLKNLLSLNSEYLDLLEVQNGQMTINEEGFQKLANAQYDKAESDLYAKYSAKMAKVATMDEATALSELQKVNNEYSTSNVNAQLKAMIDNVGLATDAFYQLANAQSGANIKGTNRTKLAQTYTKQFQAQLAVMEKGRKTIGNYTANVKANTKATGANTSSRDKNTSSTKGNTDAQKANTQALKANVDALQKQKDAINDQVNDMKDVISYIKDKVNNYIDELEDAKDAQSDLVDDAIDGIKDIKSELDDLFDDDITSEEVLANYKKGLTDLKALQEEFNNLNAQGKDTKPIEDQIQALQKSLNIQKQIASMKQTAEQADAEQKRLQNEIDALNEKNDALEEQLKYQQLLDALEKAQQTKLKVYKEGQGFVYTQDQGAISEAQKALDDWLREKKLKDQIKALEDQRDKQKAIYDQQLDDLEDLKKETDKEYDSMLSDLDEYKSKVEKRWDDQINYYKNWLKEFQKGVDAYDTEQARLKALEQTGIDFEQQGWQTRLNNLGNFVENYKKKLQELEEATRKLNEATEAYNQAQAAYSQATGSSGGGGSSSGGGGGSSSGGGGSSSGGGGGSSSPQYVDVGGGRWYYGQAYQHSKGMSYWDMVEHKNKVTSTDNHGEIFLRYQGGRLIFKNKSGHEIGVGVSEARGHYKRKLPVSYSAFATGTSSVPSNQMALVGDSPTNNELVIGSKLNGQFMNLKKGDGVVNAKSTNTFAGLINKLPELLNGHSLTATTNNNTSNDTIFSIGNITIEGSNITDITSFKNALINIKSEAIQRAYQF